jgi:hypothetical protein
MTASESATLLRDVLMDTAHDYAKVSGDDDTYAIVVCVGRKHDDEYVNVAASSQDVPVTEAISMVLRAIEKILPDDMRLALVAGKQGAVER